MSTGTGNWYIETSTDLARQGRSRSVLAKGTCLDSRAWCLLIPLREEAVV